MIIQHPTKMFDAVGVVGLPCMVVQCDKCNGLADHTGKDASEAAENAIRYDGFRSARGKKLTDPRTWLCGGCHKKNSY